MLRVIVADNFPQAEAAFRQVGTDVVIVQQQAGATPYCLIAAADEITLCPLVYSGKGGVCKNGSQFLSIY